MSIPDSIYNISPVFLQTLLLNAKAIELYMERYGEKFWKIYEEFDKLQWLPEADLIEWQNNKLRKLIRHAYETVPYYHEVMVSAKLVPDDIQTIADLPKLPILTKENIKQNSTRLISTAIKKRAIKHGHTSGTTGSPLDVCYDINTCVIHHVADWRQKNWAGLQYGEKYASLQGRVIVPLKQKTPPFWRSNFINNQLFLSSFHLAAENLPYYFEKLRKDNIQFIEGYPSNIYILAMYLNKFGQTFPLKAILTSSETLFDYQREAITKAFCCKIFDFYGMAERVIFATECDQHTGHHLNMDYGITEFLDSNDCPVSPGRLGRIVATSLHNFAMPFLRYQTNDSCSRRVEPCSCERGFPLMDAVATKNESIITLADGRLLSPSVLTHPFKPMRNIIESQIVQEALDFLVVKIVKTPNYTKDDEKRLVAAFNERLGTAVTIKVEYVDSIPRTKRGKLKWVVSNIPPSF